MRSDQLPLLELFYDALRSDVGIVVETSAPQKFIQKMYALRKKAEDPQLATLSLVLSPISPTEVWIVKNAPQD